MLAGNIGEILVPIAMRKFNEFQEARSGGAKEAGTVTSDAEKQFCMSTYDSMSVFDDYAELVRPLPLPYP